VSVWQTSLDNTNWSNALVMTNAASGTNTSTATTNQLDIGSLQYLRLRYITNGVSDQVTNLLATVTYKVSLAQDVVSAFGYDVQPASTTLSNLASANGTAIYTSWTNLLNTPAGFADGLDAGSATNSYSATTLSASGGSYAIDTLYTNLPQRTLLVGSAVLNSAVAGNANITLYYTNNSTGYTLPMQIGAGVAMADFIPFCVPLSTNATFKFVSTFGTGASGYLTNVINWQQ
jgi:hypothetical protein